MSDNVLSPRATVVAMLLAVLVIAAGVALLVLRYGGLLPAIGAGLVVTGVGVLWLLVDDGGDS